MKAKDVAKIFADFQSPWHLYRATYKYTACGPSIGMEINNKRVYCDNLPGKWVGEITLIMVSSIVEGVDETTEHYEIDVDVSNDIREEYWKVVATVNDEADAIWKNTHGCESCAKMNNVEYKCGEVVVDPDCPKCKGWGG